ncbi:MAG: MFS transporter [Beijerinckiaceae bacterium]|nr:MFS transporter [Beijerinckiaceae bacterium]
MTAVISASEAKEQDRAKGQSERSFLEVWIITIGHSLTHWYPATFYILLPLIGSELGLTYAQIGMILTAQAAAGAIANIPGGIIVDSVARKGILMAMSLFWIGVPYFAMGYTSTYWVLLVCAVLIGIGNNLWHPTAIPWLGRRFPERKGLVMAYHGMGGNVGDALAPLAAGALLTAFAWMTWRDIMFINIVPGVVMAVAILWFLGKLTAEKPGAKIKPEQQKTLGEVLKALPDLFRNKTLIFLSTSSAFRAITQGGIMAFLPLYLAKDLGYNPWWVGLSMFVLQAAGFVAAPIAGHLSDKMGRRNVIMSSMIMTAAVLAMMLFAGGTSLFVMFVALLGFFLFAIRPVLQAWLLDATPKDMGGSAIGVMFGVQSIGAAIGPVVCGLIADRWGLLSTFWFLAFTIIVANLLVFFMPKDETAKAA